jgi:single-stranded-DNA-specific exonuclease
MNASGRLETAQYALDMLTTNDSVKALELAQKLDEMNQDRRTQQDAIFKEAVIQSDKFQDNPVLVISGVGWNHGIIGIVAAKLLETYQKPAFVLEEMGELAKGSARSYGDFSAVEAIRSADDIIIKGGGHKLAAGINLRTENIDKFRVRLNEFYKAKKLTNQAELLLPREDAVAELSEVNIDLIDKLSALEPFGSGNPEPILRTDNLYVVARRTMGADGQHVKFLLRNDNNESMNMLAFNARKEWYFEVGDRLDVWYQPMFNEWKGSVSVEAKLLKVLDTRFKHTDGVQ